MTIGHGCKDHGPADSGECCEALQCCGLATSPASAGEAPLTKDDLDAFDRATQVAWVRFRDYHAACVKGRPDGLGRTTWTSQLNSYSYETLEYSDGVFTFSGRDNDGDSYSATMPGEAVLGTDEEFAAQLAKWKASTDERDAKNIADKERRDREALERLEATKAEERDRIFREEAARRGIELTS